MDEIVLSDEQVLVLAEVVGIVTAASTGQERYLADFDAANFVIDLF